LSYWFVLCLGQGLEKEREREKEHGRWVVREERDEMASEVELEAA